MSKKFLSKKKLKKFNKLIVGPTAQYIGGGLVTVAAIGTLKVLAEKYPAVRDIFRKSIEAAEDKLEYVKEEILPEEGTEERT